MDPVYSQLAPGPIPLGKSGETAVAQTGPLNVTGQEDTIFVVAFAHVQAGPGARSVTPMLHRGSGAGGPVAFTGRSIHVGTKKSKKDVVFISHHERKGTQPADGYTLTVQQQGATDDGQVTDAGVYAFVVD